jgi:hypothetical protein
VVLFSRAHQARKLEETVMHLVAIYLLVGAVVSACQMLYFGWRIWPFLRRICHHLSYWASRKVSCSWCWDELHIKRWWPEQWPSNICHRHERRILAQQAARRRARETTRQRAIMDVARQQEEVIV